MVLVECSFLISSPPCGEILKGQEITGMNDTEMEGEEPKRGRGRPRTFDQDQALERAMRVFWERGFEGASLDVLLTEMQISPSSLYAVFGDKEELFKAAIDRYLAGPGGYFGPILAADLNARETFHQLAEAVAIELTKPDQPAGCMLSLALNHCSPSADSARSIVLDRREGSLVAFQTRLERAIREKELPAETKARELARFYLTVFQGMSVQARDGASRESLLATAKSAMRAWPV
jgi:AcrR family transcriptional regulator